VVDVLDHGAVGVANGEATVDRSDERLLDEFGALSAEVLR
jgi:hypothetical protein